MTTSVYKNFVQFFKSTHLAKRNYADSEGTIFFWEVDPNPIEIINFSKNGRAIFWIVSKGQ